MRLRPDVKKQTLEYLSATVEPESTTVAAGTSVKAIAKREYGISSSRIQSFVTESNQDVVDSSGTVTRSSNLTVPPGPLVTKSPVVLPKGNRTLSELVNSVMGTSGPRTEMTVVSSNPRLKGKWEEVIKRPITLPYATHYRSYQLKAQSLEEGRRIAEHLLRLDPAVISAEASYELGITPSWSVAGADSTAVCPDSEGGDKWPFTSFPQNWSQIDQMGPVRPALVAVLDTGLADGMQSRIPLWQNSEPAQAATSDSSVGLCTNDTYGCNFLDPGTQPIDDCSVPAEYHHGTHITGLVSGRLISQNSEIDKRLEVMVLKVANEKGEIIPGYVPEAITYALSKGANIINLSLSGRRYSEIEKSMRSDRGTLFVAAAGNTNTGVGINLDDASGDQSFGYPARLSSELPNLISVASHDGSGALDCFSNYGASTIDMAAPGFEVNSLVSSSETRKLNGTSQATAIVSLAAAVLLSQGITDPAAIKHRLVASTDYKPSLSKRVFSSGVLNVSKAVFFKKDILQFSDLHIEVGEILSPLSISVDEERNDLRLRGEVYKIIPHFSENGQDVARVTYLRNGLLKNGTASSLPKIRFKTDSGTRDISVSDLIDVVPKFPGFKN